MSELALDRKKEQLTIYKCGGGFQLEAFVLEANTVGCQGGTWNSDLPLNVQGSRPNGASIKKNILACNQGSLGKAK